jgi:excisionase family DNA binding protein
MSGATTETKSGATTRRLAAVVDVPEAAAMLGIGRTLAYRLVREGDWPTPVIRMGRLIKVPLQPLHDYLQRPPDAVA